jgi:hypothetical protein
LTALIVCFLFSGFSFGKNYAERSKQQQEAGNEKSERNKM